jgi:hypothetical protein
MDLQTRKLSLIQAFLSIQNEELISKIEKMLKISNDNLTPMNLYEFNNRIDQSMEDSKNARITKASDLLKEMKEWR